MREFNQLHFCFRTGETTSWPADKRSETPKWEEVALVTQQLRKEIGSDFLLADQRVEVEARPTGIRLSGAVSSMRLKERALELAREWAGTLKVMDRMVVA